MANINQRNGRRSLARRLLRYLVDGLAYSGYALFMVPPPPEWDEAERSEPSGAPPLPGHPERLVPDAAPTPAERMLWNQLGDGPR